MMLQTAVLESGERSADLRQTPGGVRVQAQPPDGGISCPLLSKCTSFSERWTLRPRGLSCRSLLLFCSSPGSQGLSVRGTLIGQLWSCCCPSGWRVILQRGPRKAGFPRGGRDATRSGPMPQLLSRLSEPFRREPVTRLEQATEVRFRVTQVLC